MDPHRRPLRAYGVIGLAVMLISEIGMLRQIEPFWSWHTPIAWTGYILFVDALVWKRRGDSWLTTSRNEFVFLAIASIPLWIVFEWYNLYIRNWHYVHLPDHFWVRQFGYAWSFATIWPAMFETGELVGSFRKNGVGFDAGRGPAAETNVRLKPDATTETAPAPLLFASMAIGAAMLAWPIVWPSPYLAAPVWLGFIFLLDPINARLGGESLLGDLLKARPAPQSPAPSPMTRFWNLVAAGLITGIVWECWNYWARAKWIYTVPILSHLKIFEMPLPGYLGFPAFALECFTMYVTVRLCCWRGRIRPISL